MAAGLTLDPERLLWIPGRKLISIPKPRRRHGRRSRYLTSDMILDLALERYATQSVILQLADGRYDSEWAHKKIGDSFSIRAPQLGERLAFVPSATSSSPCGNSSGDTQVRSAVLTGVGSGDTPGYKRPFATERIARAARR